MVPVHPQIHEYVRQISSKTTYPIHNFAELVRALGGEEHVIEFEGHVTSPKELRHAVPDSFFPVHSEEDLTKKSEALRAKYLDDK